MIPQENNASSKSFHSFILYITGFISSIVATVAIIAGPQQCVKGEISAFTLCLLIIGTGGYATMAFFLWEKSLRKAGDRLKEKPKGHKETS